MEHILLLEDDAMIASALVYALEREGYAPTHCATLAAARAALAGQWFDLVLLDLQLPDGSGQELAKPLLERGVPVIFLTVVDEEERIVQALESGAADYVVKPFRLRELLIRIKRALRPQGGPGPRWLTLGGVRIDPLSDRVLLANGQPVELTALEYRILLLFAQNPNGLLTRAQILDQVWDQGGAFVEDNTLNVYIRRLRQKLGDAVCIQTVRGVGYRVDQAQ